MQEGRGLGIMGRVEIKMIGKNNEKFLRGIIHASERMDWA